MSTLSQLHPDQMLPVKVIPLTQGYFAIIDPENLERVQDWSRRWHLVRAPGNRPIRYAAARGMSLHRLITGEKGMDHVNGNGLDNREFNLRKATLSQNEANSGKWKVTASRFKGVNRDRARWRARIKVDQREIHLGRFKLEEDAARAYDEAALKCYGEFARTNRMMGLFPDE